MNLQLKELTSDTLVAMFCTPEKIAIKEPLTLDIWAAKDLTFNYFLLWVGLLGDVNRGTAALVPHCKSRVWAARDVLQLATQSFE